MVSSSEKTRTLRTLNKTPPPSTSPPTSAWRFQFGGVSLKQIRWNLREEERNTNCVGEIQKPQGALKTNDKRLWSFYILFTMHRSLNRTCRWPEWEIWISVSCHPLTQLQRSKMMKRLCWSASVLSATWLCLHSQAWPLFVLCLHYKGQGAYTLPQALLIKHWVCTRHAELIERARASRPPARGGPMLGGSPCRKLCSFHTDRGYNPPLPPQQTS